MIRKFLIQFESAPSTRWLLGDDNLALALRSAVGSLAVGQTLGPIPAVTVTQEETPYQAPAAPKQIEDMTEPEIFAELEQLLPSFTTREHFDRLESALHLRAACLGWTGNPLQQPPAAVLCAARRVLDDLSHQRITA